jgi:hypothetical protein
VMNVWVLPHSFLRQISLVSSLVLVSSVRVHTPQMGHFIVHVC